MTKEVTPRLVDAVTATWAEIRRRHPEVPAVVLTIGSGTHGERGRTRLGHYAARRWVPATGEGSALAELFVGGEGLRAGPAELLDTLLHEAAHGLADARGVRDTSRGGRYHNARYRTIAEELGLVVSQHPTRGWSTTTLSEATRTAYRAVLEDLAQAITAYRHPEPTGGRASNNNGVVLTCACGRRIRASDTVAAAGPITCGLCSTDFAPAS
ncbi:hypothetical protein HC251_25125 (plasmid) [Iamia sp. SCSIO 61187]|uniref:hypothetical protein n=1 Tax=Iamia sp. SCSIO 61187 TaxID=2722752 RepID=UPI001C62CE80|nr:hypothetical protein [Iamia sp. SCSIO 61187]QYG95835.1 hypothetical protein HC251_25125 [Iamia sp. SCSIO 61187]